MFTDMLKIINVAVAIRPWIKEENLKCAATRHNKKISNNQPQQF